MKITYVLYSHINKAIKIGYATNLAHRISTIQISTPEELALLFAFQGGREVETELHTLLADCRLRGEWFEYNPEAISILLQYQQKQLETLTYTDTAERTITKQLEIICKEYLQASTTRPRKRVPLSYIRSSIDIPLADIKNLMVAINYKGIRDANGLIYYYKDLTT